MTEEDEAFNEIERRSNAKKDAVRAAITHLKPKSQEEFYNELRNGVVEEVAQHIEKLKGFGQDTVSSLAIYIREMKK